MIKMVMMTTMIINYGDDDELPVEVETVCVCLEQDSAAVCTRIKNEELPNFL